MNFNCRDAGGRWRLGFQVLNKGQQSWLRAFDENLDAFLAIQHPPGEGIRTSETINERTKTYALHYTTNSNRTSTGHGHSTSTMQLRPCQPTCTTLPSSTNIGTLRCPAARARMRLSAFGSASTSYSSNWRRCHSSHSRISCVCGQRAVPYNSSLATVQHLQQLADDVVDRGLHFLDTRDVVALHHDGKVCELAAFDLAAVVAQQRNG